MRAVDYILMKGNEKMNRIEEQMTALKSEGKKAFITYITAGLPDMEGTKRILRAQFEAGIDTVELGIPFSDPVADGPVIQDASYRSIQNGTNLEKCLKMVEELREDCQIPIVFMMYYNTVLHYGIESFAKECNRVGVDGVIVPDLPFEEQEELRTALKEAGDETILIQLIAPISKERIPMLLKDARGFVYCVSSMGVTGQAADFHKNVREYLSSVKKVSNVPVMLGFGIRVPEDVKPYIDTIDGAIVGTHLIELLEKSGYDEKKAAEYVREFKKGL